MAKRKGKQQDKVWKEATAFGDTWQTEMGTLHVADCTQMGVSLVPLADADLVFCDPPFNIGHPYGVGGERYRDKMTEKDYKWFTSRWVSGMAQVVRPGGSMFCHLPDAVVAQVDMELQERGWWRANWIILHQQFGQYRDSNFIVTKHHLLYYVKPPKKLRTWNVREVLEPSTRLSMKDKRTHTAKFKGYRPFLDVWSGAYLSRVQGNDAERVCTKDGPCPNQLREMYLARIIRCSTNPGDLVVDPFTGSGTTWVVAEALKRQFIGCELLPVTAKLAAARVAKGPVRDVAGPLYVENEFSATTKTE